jgi:hypothetical protein
MLLNLTFDTFAQKLNSQFQVEHGAAVALTTELVEASQLPSSPGYEVFSIIFRGPPDKFLPQGTYRFQHNNIGAFDLFIVPIRQDQHGFYYEVVFNRQRHEGQA